jgi:predicted nuclease of predicted toxin-antitoxin system
VKFFLDENFPRKALGLLQSLGNEVFDIRGSIDEGCDDTIIFQKAQESQSIFLTTDKDFYHTIPHLYATHYGIIVINLSQPNGPAILNKLQWALSFINNNEIRNCCLMLTDKKVCYIQR